jgi:hypothetical protein
VATASVEWRQPARRFDRGWGTFPLLLRAVHWAVFVDAGDGWDTGTSVRTARASAGLEGSIDVVVGYVRRLTLTGGVARTYDGRHGVSGTGAYFRLGPSF